MSTRSGRELLAVDRKRPGKNQRIVETRVVEQAHGARHFLARFERPVPLANKRRAWLKRFLKSRVDSFFTKPEMESGHARPAIAFAQHPRNLRACGFCRRLAQEGAFAAPLRVLGRRVTGGKVVFSRKARTLLVPHPASATRSTAAADIVLIRQIGITRVADVEQIMIAMNRQHVVFGRAAAIHHVGARRIGFGQCLRNLDEFRLIFV